MVTCEPEIKKVARRADDSLLILACDGIWDCLTNEECVKTLTTNMKQRKPKEPFARCIEEMFDEIIANDIFQSSGVGTDNMTAILVQIKKK